MDPLKHLTIILNEILGTLPSVHYIFVAIDGTSENHQVDYLADKLGISFLTCSSFLEAFKTYCYDNTDQGHFNPEGNCVKNSGEQEVNLLKTVPGSTRNLQDNKKFLRRSTRHQDTMGDTKHFPSSNFLASIGKTSVSKEHEKNFQKSQIVNFTSKVKTLKKKLTLNSDTELTFPSTSNGSSVECQKCRKPFESVTDLETHLEVFHDAKLHYKCNICKRCFRTKLRFKLHLHKSIKFKNHKSLINDQGANHNDANVCLTDDSPVDVVNNVVCRLCFLQFNTSDERKYHEDNEHNSIIKNEINAGIELSILCDDTKVSRVIVFKRHQCKVCSRRFLNSIELRRHGYLHDDASKMTMASSDSNNINTLKCSECPLLFSNPVYLRNHRYTHFHVAKFQCPECPRRFKRRSHLVEHRHVHRDVRSYSCEECGRSFKFENCLRSHKAVHREDAPYQCSECGKQFKRSASLRQHSYTHGGHDFPCNECGKMFSAPYNLRAHVTTVHNSKPVEEAKICCEVCGKSFKQARYLKLHSRYHNPSSMLSCPLCPKRYARSTDLKLHLASHGDKRPFVCSACDQSFKTNSNLKRHSLIHCRNRPTRQGASSP